MSGQTTHLAERIASGKPILLAEISPPRGVDAAPVREAARRYAGKVHAVGISDNREQVSMSALAAAALVAAERLEPILHVTTRDRNRIALVSEALGTQALGIRNLLCIRRVCRTPSGSGIVRCSILEGCNGEWIR